MTEAEYKEKIARLEGIIKKQEEVTASSKRFDASSSRVSETAKTGLGKWTLDMKEFSNSVEGALKDLADAANPFNLSAFQELDESATAIQREFGATKGSIEGYKQSIADTIPELIKMGITEKDALENMSKLMNSMGSSATLGVEAITEVSAAASVSRVPIEKLASSFRDVGVSIYDVGDQMKEVTDIARAAGVSVAGVSDKVTSNLSAMNLYNFDNGVKGLAKMAVTSERLGITMDHVFQQAEKLMDPEKAIEMSASLQRLGVTSSGLLDPLRAMDMAQNDPEALQKELVNLGKEFTRMNETTGQMEILPGAKRRMREVADAVGMTAKEFASMALKAGDFDRKMQQIQFPSLATDQETKEMIAGMAQLKDGKAQINVKNEATGEFELKQVDQLTSKDIESLKKTQEEDSMTIEEVAKEQLSVSQKIESNTRGFIKGVAMGKATSEPLEKLYTNIMGAQVDITKNLAKQGSTSGVRQTYTSIAQPVEDYIAGGIVGDKDRQRSAEINAVQALIDFETNMQKNSQEFMTSTLTDIANRFKEAYAQPQKVESKSEINVNVKVTGDENTRDMNPGQIEKVVGELFTKPEFTSVANNQLAGGNQPSATTGSKNKQP
jgi:hypothetical protein